MNNNFYTSGLNENNINIIQDICSKFKSIEKAVLYGSRAKGIQKKFSDIDIALYGDFQGSNPVVSGVLGCLEDSELPYICDVIHYEEIKNPNLKANIDRDGVVIYTRDVIKSEEKNNNCCESCGMPACKDTGSPETNQYCSLCFQNGEFCYKGDLVGFKKIVDESMRYRGVNWLVRKITRLSIPWLPRWRK
jgi:predicted nucleotidyltransferase